MEKEAASSILFAVIEGMIQCFCCSKPPTINSFPLCDFCRQCLRSAPPLCPDCGQIRCQGIHCENLWFQGGQKVIHSFFSLYFLTRHGLRIIRTWKKRGGLKFDRIVLNQDSQKKIHTFYKDKEIDFILPVAHSLERLWQLKHSPNQKIARLAHLAIKRPIVNCLEIKKKSHQAKLSLEERFKNPFEFNLTQGASKIKNKKILLVDDFKTSGQTFLKTATFLKKIGALEVHALCLGVSYQKTREKPKRLTQYGNATQTAN